jgi:hypothetical protein
MCRRSLEKRMAGRDPQDGRTVLELDGGLQLRRARIMSALRIELAVSLTHL